MRICAILAAAAASAGAAMLPHVEQVGRGVWAAGFDAKRQWANCGFVAAADGALLIDPPRGIGAREYVAEVERISGKRPAGFLLTSDALPTQELTSLGVRKLEAHPAVEILPYDKGRRAIFVKASKTMFAGPAVVNGPRADVTAHDTVAWLDMLALIDSRRPESVVPGQGSWGGAQLIARQRRFLTELRRQVAYAITMGRPMDAIVAEFLLPASYYTWMPYDLPQPADLKHVYAELTAPRAPFRELAAGKPNALVLIGDRFHEPEHLEAGLRPALEAAGVKPHFTVDVAALTAANLARVDLLVILRDGMLWPGGPSKPYTIWMTPEQEKAVVDFVEGGKAFLILHNSMGLYPEKGPYLNLAGGRYIGHGPLERFRVEVVDRDHPVTRGVSDWSAADEQHTPPLDRKEATLLLRNRSDQGTTAAAGWAYEPGRGRLVHLASGHTREALEHSMYQRLLRNSVGWLLRRE